MSPKGLHAHSTVVEVTDLSVSIPVATGTAEAVRNVSFSIRAGEVLGLVGESGSGKTLTCRAVLGVLPEGCTASRGRILFDNKDVTKLDRKTWRELHGNRIGAVFQDPASYLNPSLRVGEQLSEVLRVKRGLNRREAKVRAIELLQSMGLRHPERVYKQLPSELSGGMVQRVLIAIAISCNPELLVADEATTALDVTVQAEVIDLLRELREERGLSILFVSHDLAVIADLCDFVIVFYAGEIVEMGQTSDLVRRPIHPYTEALLEIAKVSGGGGKRGVRELPVIPGRPPAPGEIALGCRFAPRCSYATAACVAADVELREVEPGRWVRCVLAEDRAGIQRA